jgi:mannose-1-phosphate guanylyltransferase/mannose-6-phosphate isomerase
MKIVIRAGGIGTRLWPMSRSNNPKQFQTIVGNKSMIRTTFDRLSPKLVDPNDVFVSVNETQIDKVKRGLPEISVENLIIETDTRNTGPAICLEICFLEKKLSSDDIIASLPSDDYISNNDAFISLLLAAEEFIKLNPDFILTPGIKPSYPDTGYSYLKAGKNLQKIGEENIYEVVDWVEKPEPDYCEELIKSGVYFYHTGMYVWQLKNIVSLWEKMQPEMMSICRKIVDLPDMKNPEAKKLYSRLEKISVESAITHKFDKIAMSVSNRLGWSDLGKWHIIKKVLKEDERENLEIGQVYSQRVSDSIIYSGDKNKLIVVNEVNGLAIIDTPDVLFVSSLEKSHEIKKILEILKKDNKEKYL